jgi:geranylgeranyl diphosphate synthase type I
VELEEFLVTQRHDIDAQLSRVIPSDSPIEELYDAQWAFIRQGGKRWRPILALLVHQTLGGSTEAVLPFAAAIELVHTPPPPPPPPPPKAINIGDNLLNKAYESATLLGEKGFPAERVLWSVRLLCKATVFLSEGQAMEMNFLNRWDVTEEEYLEMVWKKTGILVSAAVAGGAYLAGADDAIVDRMMEYGRLIGPAFQITDDVLNVAGEYDRYQKEIGGDIGEGKKTMMIIHVLNHASGPEVEKARGILSRARGETTQKDYGYILDLMEKYGSVEHARSVAESRISGAEQRLMCLPQSRERDILRELTRFLVRRDY